MFIKDTKFLVEFSEYAEKHFCKDFAKKYKTKKWTETKRTIQITLERCFAFSKTNLIDELRFSRQEGAGIFKLDFRVAGTNFSPKTSGNRAIFYLCNVRNQITILLVYTKGHCRKGQSENQWILEHIKTNFPEYKNLC